MIINKTTSLTIEAEGAYEIVTGNLIDVIAWLQQLRLPALISHADFGVLLKTDHERNIFEFGLRFGGLLMNERNAREQAN